MTIEEIAKKLDDCANARCEGCEYLCANMSLCQQNIISDMANECRKLVEQMGDDGK